MPFGGCGFLFHTTKGVNVCAALSTIPGISYMLSKCHLWFVSGKEALLGCCWCTQAESKSSVEVSGSRGSDETPSTRGMLWRQVTENQTHNALHNKEFIFFHMPRTLEVDSCWG